MIAVIRMPFQPLHPNNSADLATLVSIWNAACGPDLTISSRFAAFNLHPAMGALQAGQIAVQNSMPAGFVLCSAFHGDPAASPSDMGWIDALAVLPSVQRQGTGGALLAWAENWLREHGCTATRLGASLRPFVAGYPVELGNESYFRRRGFKARAGSEYVWDVARDLGDYAPRQPIDQGTIRPAQPGEENALLEFFQREFPNRWRFEFEEFLRLSDRISDWIVLVTERRIDGFARLTFEDSVQPLDRFYPYRLPRPWAQLGPIGVSQDIRGSGLGGALLEASLVHLRDRGVRGCVIDWTALLDFYAKFGFKAFRQYAMLSKVL